MVQPMKYRGSYRSTTKEQLAAIYAAYDQRLALDSEIAQTRRYLAQLLAKREAMQARAIADAIGVSQKVVKYYWDQLDEAQDDYL